MSKSKAKVVEVAPLLKLDLGCGLKIQEGFIGVDIRSYGDLPIVKVDLRKKWPWKDNSVDEIYCAQFLEHLEPMERVHFANETYRVLKPNCKATIITPYWGSMRAYGDMTHKWPPVSEFWYLYLDKAWRDKEAPHSVEYKCDFEIGWGHNPNAVFQGRNDDYVRNAVNHWLNGANDLIAFITPRK